MNIFNQQLARILQSFMARGRRHYGHHSHSHSHVMQRNSAALLMSSSAYEQTFDLLLNCTIPATILNGVYTFMGNEASFKAQSESGLDIASQLQPPQQPLMQLNITQEGIMPPGNPADIQMMLRDNLMMQPQLPPGQNLTPEGSVGSIQQAKITLLGAKTRPSSSSCYILTIILGSVLIFPLLFMCCMWWKKFVFPTYELTAEAYRSVARFVAKSPNCFTLDLVVNDNAFNFEKARILYEALSASHINTFNFTNRVLNCNWKDNEADRFRENMTPIKSLNIKSSIVWADMEF